MKLKKIISAAAAAALSAAIMTGCEGTPDTGNIQTESGTAAAYADPINFTAPEPGEKIVVITVKDYGEIKIKLFPEQTPKAVENFLGLTEMGYYDELIFHRIIPDFMNQGGDPKGNGTGGKSMWGEEFQGELGEGLYHFSGAVAYAHSQTFTNGSQFYIVNTDEGDCQYGATYLDDGTYKEFTSFEELGNDYPESVKQLYLEKGGVPFLDGGYTVFGQVIEGMDVVRAMSEVETDDNDKPLKQVLMESVRIEEYK